MHGKCRVFVSPFSLSLRSWALLVDGVGDGRVINAVAALMVRVSFMSLTGRIRPYLWWFCRRWHKSLGGISEERSLALSWHGVAV